MLFLAIFSLLMALLSPAEVALPLIKPGQVWPLQTLGKQAERTGGQWPVAYDSSLQILACGVSCLESTTSQWITWFLRLLLPGGLWVPWSYYFPVDVSRLGITCSRGATETGAS